MHHFYFYLRIENLWEFHAGKHQGRKYTCSHPDFIFNYYLRAYGVLISRHLQQTYVEVIMMKTISHCFRIKIHIMLPRIMLLGAFWGTLIHIATTHCLVLFATRHYLLLFATSAVFRALVAFCVLLLVSRITTLIYWLLWSFIPQQWMTIVVVW